MLYERLGVSRNATKEEIVKAFRDKAKIHHPDHGGEPLEFHKLKEAYNILIDEEMRHEYDITGMLPNFNDQQEINNMLSLFFQRVLYADPRVNIVNEVKHLIQIELDNLTKKSNELNNKKSNFCNLCHKRVRSINSTQSMAENIFEGLYSETIQQLDIEIVGVNRNKKLLNQCLGLMDETKDIKFS